MSEPDFTLLAVSRSQIERVTGTKLATVDYWTRTGVIRPTLDTRVTPGRIIRQYSYLDVMALLVTQQLRERAISLQHIRAIVDYLRADGFSRPLTEIRYAVVAGHLFLQLPDGQWVDGRNPDQGIVPESLALEPLRANLRSKVARPSDSYGQTEKRRGTMGSKELIAGTRIAVATIRRYVQAGRTDQQILSSFPSLSTADIEGVRFSPAA
jgi:uncharacterized protein (DUF433 family)/DNA-binding transcriptional MerR regulator